MPRRIHIIPTGFDRHRLITPFVKGDLEADEVILIHTKTEGGKYEQHQEEVSLVNETVERLKEDFENYADVSEVKKMSYAEISSVGGEELERDDIYHYDRIYRNAYDFLKEKVDRGHTVYVNVSSMPRTVVFGFSTAATTLVSDDPDIQDCLHIYYVAPETYYGPQMRDRLGETSDFLNHLRYELDNLLNMNEGEEVPSLFEKVREIRGEIEEHHESVRKTHTEVERYGLTKGAMEIDNSYHIEFPHFRHPDVAGGEVAILYVLRRIGEANSISELARELAGVLESGDKETLKSMVQYNVLKLVKKGFVRREETEGKGYRYQLSKMGELWSEKHDIEARLQEYKKRRTERQKSD